MFEKVKGFLRGMGRSLNMSPRNINLLDDFMEFKKVFHGDSYETVILRVFFSKDNNKQEFEVLTYFIEKGLLELIADVIGEIDEDEIEGIRLDQPLLHKQMEGDIIYISVYRKVYEDDTMYEGLTVNVLGNYKGLLVNMEIGITSTDMYVIRLVVQ